MIVREINNSDFDDLQVLYSELSSEKSNTSSDDMRRHFQDNISNQNVKYFVAENNGKLIATCYVFIIPNLTRGLRNIAYIENVVTRQEYRRKGAGQAVMEMAIRFAKESNCYKVVLQSGNARKEAHMFYEKLGFDGNSKKAFEIRF